MWKGILVGLVALPVVALFGGTGILFYQIGQSWDARSTDSLITGLVATCGGGSVVIGILLALLVGVPLALRAYERGGQARQVWPEPAYRALPPGQALPGWAQQPPQLTDGQQGAWQSLGPGAYDVWQEQQPAEPVQADWRG